MSDDKQPAPWSDREALVYIFSAIEFSNVKIDFTNAPAPPGYSARDCAQKMNKFKIALRAEIDAIKHSSLASAPAPAPAPAPPTLENDTGFKRKATDSEEDTVVEKLPRKRGRPKKGDQKPKVEDSKHVVKVPRKRGRPRKIPRAPKNEPVAEDAA